MNQVRAGAVLSYVSLFLTTFLGVVYTPFMLRQMGQSEFGLYSLAASVIAYLTLFDFGFGNAVVRFTAKFRAEGKVREQYEMFGLFLLLYCAIAVLAGTAGWFLCAHAEAMFGATMTAEELSRARLILGLLAGNLALTFPFTIFRSIITAYEDFVFQRLVNIARILLQTGIMIPLLLWGYKAVALSVLLNRTRLGRHICAVGSNERVARYSGIRTGAVKYATYLIAGLTAGISALLFGSRLNAVSSTSAGLSYELDAIAAVIIGGSSMNGGKASVWGTLAGVLILGIVSNVLDMWGISVTLQGTVKGLVIIIAVMIQRKTTA